MLEPKVNEGLEVLDRDVPLVDLHRVETVTNGSPDTVVVSMERVLQCVQNLVRCLEALDRRDVLPDRVAVTLGAADRGRIERAEKPRVQLGVVDVEQAECANDAGPSGRHHERVDRSTRRVDEGLVRQRTKVVTPPCENVPFALASGLVAEFSMPSSALLNVGRRLHGRWALRHGHPEFSANTGDALVGRLALSLYVAVARARRAATLSISHELLPLGVARRRCDGRRRAVLLAVSDRSRLLCSSSAPKVHRPTRSGLRPLAPASRPGALAFRTR